MIVKNGIPIILNLSTTLDAVFNFILSCVSSSSITELSFGAKEKRKHFLVKEIIKQS